MNVIALAFLVRTDVFTMVLTSFGRLTVISLASLSNVIGEHYMIFNDYHGEYVPIVFIGSLPDYMLKADLNF